MSLLYKIISYVLFLFILPVLPFMPKIRGGFLERLGFGRTRTAGKRTIWMHGASAGDLAALHPMAEEIKSRRPELPIYVTTITNTGIIMGGKKYSGLAEVGYAPVDIPFSVRRAVSAISPSVVLLEYTEIWPNMMEAAKAAGSKVVMVNGRFSSARVAWYRAFFKAVGNPLKNVDMFLMRDELEAENAIQVGADKSRIHVTGNTKFDALIKTALGPEPKGLGEVLWAGHGKAVVFGSIHEGEEEMSLDVLLELRKTVPGLRALIAPRYPERARPILSAARDRKLSAVLRSSSTGAGAPPDVVVIDTIGELSQVYRYGDIAFVGGSMTTRGGQNILEPAVQGRVVVFGPHIHNFADSASLLVGRGGFMVSNKKALVAVMKELLQRDRKLAELGAMGRKVVLGISGATRKNVDLILELLERGGR
jgi:3-deoxy-D-manno-octulosonic-acid transferase